MAGYTSQSRPTSAPYASHSGRPHITPHNSQTVMERVRSWRPKTTSELRGGYFKKHFADDLAAALSEFLGTVTFLIIGLGGIQAAAASVNASAAADTANSGGAASVNTVASIEQLLYISASMGLALLGSAWIFFRVTGSAFNPNISLALWLCNVITFPRFILYCIAQMLGGIVASAILAGILPGTIAVTPSLGAGVNRAQGVWIEAFITAALCLSVLMLAVEKHRATAWAPIGIALTLFACHLMAVIYTGAAMNVARAFGPSVITGFSNDHWVYWVGDGIGSLLAVAIYIVLKAARYWRLNPDSDAPDHFKSPELFSPTGSEPRSLELATQPNPRDRANRASDARTLAATSSAGDNGLTTEKRYGQEQV